MVEIYAQHELVYTYRGPLKRVKDQRR
jgi:hypothetical protein